MKKALILSTVFVLAFAFSAFAAGEKDFERFFDNANDIEHEYLDVKNTASNQALSEFIEENGNLFDGYHAADEDILRNSAPKAGPNPTYNEDYDA